MSQASKIEWTDATWNIVTGCSVISPGCKNCYAMRLAGTRLRNHPSRAGLTQPSKAGPVWTGETRVNWDWIDQPLGWGRPRTIFVCAHGDLFHESVDKDDIAQIYGVMIAAHHLRGHRFQVLTKRADRARSLLNNDDFWDIANADAWMRVMNRTDPLDRRSDDARATLDDYGPEAPPPGIWLGISAENQHWLLQRAPHLLETPAEVRFLSLEPCLSEMDIEPFVLPVRQWDNGWLNNYPYNYPKSQIDWVIGGGESGPGARPMPLEAAQTLRDQCEAAGVPFFFKQWGQWLPNGQTMADGRVWSNDSGHSLHAVKSMTGRYLDGQLHDAMPEVAA